MRIRPRMVQDWKSLGWVLVDGFGEREDQRKGMTYPLETNISFEGRNPLNTSPAVDVMNESSIQKLMKTLRMKRPTKASNIRRRRSVPSAL